MTVLSANRTAGTAQRTCTMCFGLLLSGADGFTRCASCGTEDDWLEMSLAPAPKVVKGDTGPKIHPATAQRDFDGYRAASQRAEEAKAPAPVRCLTCLANIPGGDMHGLQPGARGTRGRGSQGAEGPVLVRHREGLRRRPQVRTQGRRCEGRQPPGAGNYSARTRRRPTGRREQHPPVRGIPNTQATFLLQYPM